MVVDGGWSTTAGRLILLSTGNYVVPGCGVDRGFSSDSKRWNLLQFIGEVRYATHCVVILRWVTYRVTSVTLSGFMYLLGKEHED